MNAPMTTATLDRIASVTGRVLSQLRRDRRQIALSLVFPLVVVYFLRVLVDALAGPGFDATVYVIPYGAFIVHFITFILTAIVLVRERTEGTLARMFVAGYRQVDIVTGYLLAYSLLVTAQSILILAELSLLFDLSYEFGQYAAIYLIMWLLALISMILGMFLSNFARNVGQVIPFIPLIIISVIISGMLIPFERLPEWSQVTAHLTPMFYANDILQGLIRGRALLDDWTILVNLVLYGLILLALATLTLRELD